MPFGDRNAERDPRRRRRWVALAVVVVVALIGLSIYVAMFLLSSLVIGPAISGGSSKAPSIERPSGHAGHHK